jgi:hypothetical protein
MAGDLLIIVPSRGRPGNVERLLDAVHQTTRATTHVHVAVDNDDPEEAACWAAWNRHRATGDRLQTGPRMGLVAWTNKIAAARAGEYQALASFGDDHLPRTKGWDTACLRALADMGGTGICYPWDGVREDIPEAPVVSADIVQALGWFFPPPLRHYFGDDALGAIGRGAGCLRHLRAVWVEHLTPANGKAPGDQTYRDNSASISADKAAYQQWRQEHLPATVAAVRELRERTPAPV